MIVQNQKIFGFISMYSKISNAPPFYNCEHEKFDHIVYVS